ncbi:hypothetical protein PRK78_006832 [Emydomyces testavorans]|uniref:Carrier domain-containing protein n=1 Tax=Emydomyces testavorans TaxID=2070801 RepID=A0AAF0DP61_9EURO|nr:hypothetical protein PRK78_006832 [Emydomyces testavorans]
MYHAAQSFPQCLSLDTMFEYHTAPDHTSFRSASPLSFDLRAIENDVQDATQALEQSLAFESDFSSELPVINAISKQAALNPFVPAIDAWDRGLTYAELDEQSDRLAVYLLDLGLKEGDLVPICFEKSVWTIVTMLAILKCGAAFVPLDPAYPTARFKEIVSQCDANVVLAAPCCTDRIPFGRVISICEDLVQSIPRGKPLRSTTSHGQNISYAMFTSGSSGKPKGVLISHRSLFTSVISHGTQLNINRFSRVLQFTSYTFDPSITEIFATLILGGCICVPEPAARVNNLAGCINDLKVNWAFFTPSVLRLVEPEDVPSLKTIAVGGEAVTQDCVDRWASRVQLFNAYGPTECTVFSTIGSLSPVSNPRNIGRAVACNTWIIEQDNFHKLAPSGAVGELLIEGPILAQGYLKDPQGTAKAFIEDPEWAKVENISDSPRRFHRTGDLVYENPDGTIVYAGRKDAQVKLRGQLVDLQEIEQCILHTLPKAQTVVDIVSSGEYAQELVAFLCLQPNNVNVVGQTPKLDPCQGSDPTLERIRDNLRDQLPPYMVPSIFIPVSHIPRSSSDKTDRKLLKCLAINHLTNLRTWQNKSADNSTSYTREEKALRRAWADIIGLEESVIHAKSSFLAIGGDSIAAIRLVRLARDRGLILSHADIMSRPVLRDMSLKVRISDGIDTSPITQPFDIVKRHRQQDISELLVQAAYQCEVTMHQIDDIYPATPIQEGLIALSLNTSGSYIGLYTFRLPGTINTECFKRAWNEAAQQSPILRTRFIYADVSQLYQVVLNGDAIWTPAEDMEEEKVSLGKQLVNVTLKTDLSGDRYFVLRIHHALYDGWSLVQHLKLVDTIYRGVRPTLSLPFRDFICHIQALPVQETEEFWSDYLEDFESSPFPEPPKQQKPTAFSHLRIKAIVEKRSHVATLSTLIQAAWAIAVAQQTKSRDVIFGVTLSGRDTSLPNIDSVAGPTIATVPLRFPVDPSMTVANFIATLQARSTEMASHQHFGLQNIKKLGHSARLACEFQSLMVVQPQEIQLRSEEEVAGTALFRLHENSEMVTAYSLLIEAVIQDMSVAVHAQYDERAITSQRMDALLEQWRNVFHQLCNAESSLSLGELQVVGQSDLKTLYTWNDSIPDRETRLFDHAITMWSDSQPTAPAICSWDLELTYQELDSVSSRIAGYLMSLGVGPKSVLPICLEKSGMTILVMLGILKTGAAFALMDSAQPRNRLQAIHKQTQAK